MKAKQTNVQYMRPRFGAHPRHVVCTTAVQEGWKLPLVSSC